MLNRVASQPVDHTDVATPMPARLMNPDAVETLRGGPAVDDHLNRVRRPACESSDLQGRSPAQRRTGSSVEQCSPSSGVVEQGPGERGHHDGTDGTPAICRDLRLDDGRPSSVLVQLPQGEETCLVPGQIHEDLIRLDPKAASTHAHDRTTAQPSPTWRGANLGMMRRRLGPMWTLKASLDLSGSR